MGRILHKHVATGSLSAALTRLRHPSVQACRWRCTAPGSRAAAACASGVSIRPAKTLWVRTRCTFSVLLSASLRRSELCASALMPACQPAPCRSACSHACPLACPPAWPGGPPPPPPPACLPTHLPACHLQLPAVNNASLMITDSCKDCQGDSLLVSTGSLPLPSLSMPCSWYS